MKALLLPLGLVVFGAGAGGAAGYFLHVPETPDPEMVAKAVMEKPEEDPPADYVKLNNQFIVPIVKQGEVSALVVMSLHLQVDIGTTDPVYGAEPRIRDLFLQVLFDHANAGGFDGNFTDSGQIEILKRNLTEAGRQELGDTLQTVLIQNLDRQDV